MEEPLLSSYGKVSSLTSPVNEMMASFAKEFRPNKDINLGVGYVNEDTIPKQLIREALTKVIDNPSIKTSMNYGGSQGSVNLIKAIRDYHVDNNILEKSVLDQKDILIGANGATSILEGISQILPKGIIITADPWYYIYGEYLERIGFEVITIPEDQEGVKTEVLEEKLQHIDVTQISYLYFVTINNPSGIILSNHRRKEIIRIAKKISDKVNRRVPVFFDNAYGTLIHGQVDKPQSPLAYDEYGLVYEIGTLSKILAPGLRIGFMVGPKSNIMKTMIQRTCDVGFSASLINQEISAYILKNNINDQVEKVNKTYGKKAKKTRIWLNDYLGEFMDKYSGGDAGFYYYITFNNIETHPNSAFFKFLSRETGDPLIDKEEQNKKAKVVYLPSIYCTHPCGTLKDISKKQLRLSYGYESLENIHAAIKLMREACLYASTKNKPTSN